MLRISAEKAIWPRDFVRPKTAAIARDASHGQDAAIDAVTSSFRGTSQAAFAKLADTAGKTNWSDTLPLGFAACWSRLPGKTNTQPAIIPLRSSGGESGNHVIALSRRCQATSPDAPTKLS